MPSYVLDASAVLAVLNEEPGAEIVSAFLAEPDGECMVHAINLCEVYYIVAGREDSDTAKAVIEDFTSLGVSVREDLDQPLCMRAGDLKLYVQNNSESRASVADALCAALAERESCLVVTSDRKGFEPLAIAKLCSVQFIR